MKDLVKQFQNIYWKMSGKKKLGKFKFLDMEDGYYILHDRRGKELPNDAEYILKDKKNISRTSYTKINKKTGTPHVSVDVHIEELEDIIKEAKKRSKSLGKKGKQIYSHLNSELSFFIHF